MSNNVYVSWPDYNWTQPQPLKIFNDPTNKDNNVYKYQNYRYEGAVPDITKSLPRGHTMTLFDNRPITNFTGINVLADNNGVGYPLISKNIYNLNLDMSKYDYLVPGQTDLKNPVLVWYAWRYVAGEKVELGDGLSMARIDNNGNPTNTWSNYTKFYITRDSYIGELTQCCLSKSKDNAGHTCDPELLTGDSNRCNSVYRDYCAQSTNFNSDPVCRRFALRQNDTDEPFLFDTLATNYCKKNKTDEFCSCKYNDTVLPNLDPSAAAYIKNSKCWSGKCQESGYLTKAQSEFNCPDVNVCSSLVNVSGGEIDNIKQSCGNGKPETVQFNYTPLFIILIMFFLVLLVVIYKYVATTVESTVPKKF